MKRFSVISVLIIAALSLFVSSVASKRRGMIASADLTVSKVDTPDPVTGGSELTYTITITNNGPDPASNASWSDTLPSETTFVSLSDESGWSCTTPSFGGVGTISCTNPSFGVGSSVFTLTVTVNPEVADNTIISNTVTVTSSTPDGNPGDESATATTTANAFSSPASITGNKSVSGSTSEGSTVSYIVSLANSSSSAQLDNPGDEFTDVLSSDLTLVSADASSGTATANVGTNTVTWNGRIEGSDSVTIVINATINSGTEGHTISNQGNISYDADGNGTNEASAQTNQADFMVGAPSNNADLTLFKSGPAQVHADTDITYTITVTNLSENAATSASFTDTLPGSVPSGSTLTFVSFSQLSGPSWDCGSPSSTTSCSIANLPSNSTSVFTFVGHVPAGTPDGRQYTNETTVVSANDPNSENNGSASVATVSSCFTDQTVTTNADSGAGSLRQAILEACDGSTIGFDLTQFASPILLTSDELLINKNLTIAGPAAALLTVQRAEGSSNFRIFEIAAGSLTVNISGLTIANGRAANGVSGDGAAGGGILNNAGAALNLEGVGVSANQAGTAGSGGFYGGFGGGIANLGTLTLSNSTVANNTGGVGSGDGNRGGGGGGISNGGLSSNPGTLTIINSTISGNSAGSSSLEGSSGGGISNNAGSSARIQNSTISGNSAGAGCEGCLGGSGGGIYDGGGNSGSLSLTNVTISANQSGTGTPGGNGGGVFSIASSSAPNLRNTIIAGNTVAAGGQGPDLAGAFNSQDYNLIGNASGATLTGATAHNIINQDAKLGPLANNGGPTQTHALLGGSPALDAGDNCVTDPDHCSDANVSQVTSDQRGLNRQVDSYDVDATARVDIGAFEAQVSIEDIPDKSTNEDTQLQFTFNLGGPFTSVTAVSANTTLVPNNPANIAISGSGDTRTLTINPVANEFGTSTITVTVSDNNGQSMIDTFLLTVNAVNDAPSFTKGPDQAVIEDTSTQAVLNWATGISAGPENESAQQLTFVVTGNTNPTLFSIAPAISNTGTLTYTPAADAYGTATITVVLQDDGGTAYGGQDTSAPQTFTITVNPVNDVPSFTKGPDQTVLINAGPQTVTNWATNISPGPNESDQTLTFQVVGNSNSGLFSAGPSISANGTLTYTPAANVNGFANITISLKDNGGTSNGGVDTSPTQTFTITVNCGTTVVTNTNDSGAGSLRDTILHACPGTTITFDPEVFNPAGGPYTITLTSSQLTVDKNLNINGPGVDQLTVSGNNARRVFNVSAGTVSINDLTVANGRVNNANGGGLANFGNLTLANVKFTGNTALGATGTGGAIFNNGPLAITNSTITGNSSITSGGAIENLAISAPFSMSITNSTIGDSGAQTNGGAINSTGVAAFSLTINGSTFSGTSAGGTGGAIGIFNTSSTVTISNSTISGSTAQNGGGIALGSGVSATFTNVTISKNRSSTTTPNTGSGGGLFVTSGGIAVLRNTLLAGNFKNLSPSTTPDDIAGTVDASSSFNLIGPGGSGGLTNGVNNNQVNVSNPLLANLASFGGLTQTHALLPGSPAINTGSNTLANNAGLTNDQRGPGFNRIVAGTVDIGAFEARGFTIQVASGTPQSATILSAFGSPLVVSVDGVGGDPVNGGIVTFTAPASGASAVLNGSGNTTNVNIAAGRASANATANGIAGSYNVTAVAPGGNTVSFALTNNKATTTTAVTSSVNPSDLNQNVTFTATVSSVAIPTGTVQFKDNGTNLGSPVALNASGVAQLTTSTLTTGSHTITADYSGDANFLASSGSLSGGQVVLFRPLIRFSQPTYSVNENGNFLTITVLRSGDTSPAVTVDYATPDDSAAMTFVPCSTANGVGSPRCDFITALGTLRFAAGETSKTFNMLISQDAWVEGNETVPLTLSNLTGGAAFQQPGDANAVLTIVDDDLSQSSANPIDTTDTFVRQQYHDFLNREADAQGLAFWTDNIDKCNDSSRRPPNQTVAQCLEIQRINTSAAFFLSIEFQNTGYFVERMYKSGFGDISPPTVPVPVRFSNFIVDTQEIGRNVVVGQGNWQAQLDVNKKAFALAFVQRPAFLNRYPAVTSATGLVDSLNTNAGMVLSDSERSSLITELNANPADPALRADVLMKVAENAVLFQRESNRAFVLMQYFGYLRRNPDAAPEATLNFNGYNFWLGKLNQANGDYVAAELIKAFVNSSEYRGRFGP